VTTLMAERNYQFRERMLEVHRPNRRMPWVERRSNEIEVTSDWTIYLPDSADVVLYNAARDLEDYLLVSMGVCCPVKKGGEIPTNAIVYSINPSLQDNEYHFAVKEHTVELCGQDSKAAAQAGYYFEDLMNLTEAPFLEKQDIKKKPMFSPRMVHSGFGLDMFPDEHIRNIAHYGINALLIFVCDINKTPHGYCDFNNLIYRASRYGVDVYAYSYMHNEVYPEGEEGEAFYEQLYGSLFHACPNLKGIIFVGESCEFPSRDTRTTGMLRKYNFDENGKKIIKDKPSPGWFPCSDYPVWLDMVKNIIRRHKEDADIVFWTYNWGWIEEQERLELLQNLPTDITLLATFEMCQYVERDGVTNRTVDYTLFFEGPSKYFASEARMAKERGIRLYTMSNTGGLTWDIGVIPYEPAPYQWIKRYKAMWKAHEEWGLCGTMDCHHYGFYPSFVSELAKWAFYSPKSDMEEILRKIAVRDFSKETAEAVLQAWQCFSTGIYNLVSTNADQYGPCRVGPSYPLLLFQNEDAVFPSPSYAHSGGNAICNPRYPYILTEEEQRERNRQVIYTENEQYEHLEYELKSYQKVYELYGKGCDILEKQISQIHPNKQEEAKRLLNLCRFIANTVKTAIHAKQWYVCKQSLKVSYGEAKEKIINDMKNVLFAEIENANNTIPLVEFDSRLGYEPSMEYMCDREHIEWKIKMTEQSLKELESMENSL